jgi:opacity protein-like surface antigen
MRRRSILLALSLLILAVPPATATTFVDSVYGTPSDAANGRSAAMGSVGVSLLQGSSALVQNPALLALHGAEQGRWLFDASANLTQANENTFIPLYDTFGDFTGESAIAINRNTYGGAEGGLVFSVDPQRRVSVAAGIFERYDVDYDYFEEVRTTANTDEILQFNDITHDGRLRSASAGLGAAVHEKLRLGAAVHYFFGELDFERREAQISGDPMVNTVLRDLDGWGWSVGASIDPIERVSLGVNYEGKAALSGEHTSRFTAQGITVADPEAAADGDYDLDYPAALTFGITYRPRHELTTTFSAEACRRWWSELEDGYADARPGSAAKALVGDASANYRDTWDFRLGVEHVFYNGMPVRFGFRYLENYADAESDRAIFSAGIGHDVGGYRLDVTGQFHHQMFRRGFLFSRDDQSTQEQATTRVEDTVIRLVVGVERAF